MGKVAVCFPGQGAQYVGMGLELSEQYAEAKAVFAEVDEALGSRLSDICFTGPQDELVLTENTQPAILAASIAAWRVLQAHGITADYAAGLSLGEYSAHVAAGSMTLADAAVIVRKRGQFMQDAVAPGIGGMAAIMGLEPAEVVDICSVAQESTKAIVRAANFNCPGQIVVSGHKQAVDVAAGLAKERGAKRVVELAVSAPFHCPLMEPAKKRLAEVLHAAAIGRAQMPVITNVAAQPVTEPADIALALTAQVTSTVRWEESVRYLIGQGVGLFIEAGPGKSLCGFIRKIDPSVTAVSVSQSGDVDAALESWQEVC